MFLCDGFQSNVMETSVCLEGTKSILKTSVLLWRIIGRLEMTYDQTCRATGMVL